MIRKFLSNRSGNFGILAGIAMIPLALGVGLAVDYSRWLSAHDHLQDLADTASLALAASREKDETKLRKMADDYVKANAKYREIGPVKIASLEADDNQIDLGLEAELPTYFMGLANINEMNVGASALSIRAVSGSVELALVLDNTDSMNVDDKIGTLKTAATDLVKKLFENKDAVVRVALVPYGEQINVGMANRYASWVSVPDDYTKTTPATGACKTISTKNGACKKKAPVTSCQVEKDGVMVTQQCGGNCTEYEQIPITPYEQCPKDTVNSYKWFGCVGSRVSGGKLVLNDQTPTVKYPGLLSSPSSQKCLTEVLPLTDKKDTVDAAIKGMITSRSGYTPQTYIPAGVIWGINMLSPTEPYTEGEAYDLANKKPRKVMVVMTDGLNTRRVVTSGASMGDYTSANAAQRIQTNTDTTTVCNYAKAQKIEIFTVAFKVDDGPAKTMLQGCATDAEHYYDATDPEKLLAAFAGIAQSLTQVRLAR